MEIGAVVGAETSILLPGQRATAVKFRKTNLMLRQYKPPRPGTLVTASTTANRLGMVHTTSKLLAMVRTQVMVPLGMANKRPQVQLRGVVTTPRNSRKWFQKCVVLLLIVLLTIVEMPHYVTITSS
jgi:hypothetical protein